MLLEPGRRVRKTANLDKRLDNLPVTRVDSASKVRSDMTRYSGVVVRLPPETE